jgi:WD40 repeat protein
MGLVYRALEVRPARTVAIKVIRPELAADAEFRARFNQEATLAAQIEHPNVIPIYGVGEEDGLLYIVMRFVEGMDLGDLLRARGRLAPGHAARIATQIAAALDAAHARGLVHRDVKPANVLVTAPDEHLYLTDFGLTKRVTDTSLGITPTGGWVGTLDYIAPEQLSGGRVDGRSDVYALGCVLYVLLTGAVPFPQGPEAAKIFAHLTSPPPRPSEAVPGLPAALDEVIARAMAKDPAARYASAGDLAQAACAAAAGSAADPATGSTVDGRGALHGVPTLPRVFVAHPGLAGLRQSLLGSGSGVGLHGPSGIGKTVMAAAVAQDPEIRRHFLDGVHWISLGGPRDAVAAQIDLLSTLGSSHAGPSTTADGLALLRDVLADRRCLLIVDDVCTTQGAEAFRAVGATGRILFTTRDPQLLEPVDAECREVDVLPISAARQLLGRLTGIRADALPAEGERILELTGRLTLAVALVGAAIGRGAIGWRQVVDQLGREPGPASTAMEIAVAALDEPLARAYRQLAVYPEGTRVPVAAVARLWSNGSGAEAHDSISELADRGLLALDGDAISLHSLHREALQRWTIDPRRGHAELLAAYRVLLPSGQRWRDLPRDEPYIWEHLLDHLTGAGEDDAAVTSDLTYLAVRSFRSGPYAAERDLATAAARRPDDAALGWLLGLLRRWGPAFAGHRTLSDLAATVASRTSDAPAELDRGQLAELLPARFLTAHWGLPASPPALVCAIEGHGGPISGLAFSADARRLVSAGDDGTVRRWDPVSGRLCATLESHVGPLRAVAFSGEADQAAIAGDDGRVQLWDIDRGELHASLDPRTGWVWALAFAHDGRWLASAGSDGIVRLWDPRSGDAAATLEGHADWVRALAFSADGSRLASAGNDGTVRLWDPARPAAAAVILETSRGRMLTLALSPDGRWLASAGDDSQVSVRQTRGGQPGPGLKGHAGRVRALGFSPDGQQLASGGDDGTVRLWDALSGEALNSLDGCGSRVRILAYSPDGRRLASAGDDATVRLWNPTREGAGANWVWALALSRDGRQVAVGREPSMVCILDPASGETRASFNGHPERVRAIAFSPDARHLASGGTQGTVTLWDLGSGVPCASLSGDSGRVRSVGFSPDGRWLAIAGDDDETVQLWDLGSTPPGPTRLGPSGHVRALAFSPDGRRLASAGGDGTIRLWDPVSGEPDVTLEGHHSPVHAIAFAPSGGELASAGEDGTVRLWHPASGEATGTLAGHDSSVTALAYAPGGGELLSGGEDGMVRLWDPRRRAPVSGLGLGLTVGGLVWGPFGITVSAQTHVIQLAVVE